MRLCCCCGLAFVSVMRNYLMLRKAEVEHLLQEMDTLTSVGRTLISGFEGRCRWHLSCFKMHLHCCDDCAAALFLGSHVPDGEGHLKAALDKNEGNLGALLAVTTHVCGLPNGI